MSQIFEVSTRRPAVNWQNMPLKTLTERIMLRRMPHSNPNPEFAPSERVNAHRKLAEDFTRRVLGLEWAWISDQSSLWDFHTEKTNDALFAKIRNVYGVDVSDISSGRLYEILERIAGNGFS